MPEQPLAPVPEGPEWQDSVRADRTPKLHPYRLCLFPVRRDIYHRDLEAVLPIGTQVCSPPPIWAGRGGVVAKYLHVTRPFRFSVADQKLCAAMPRVAPDALHRPGSLTSYQEHALRCFAFVAPHVLDTEAGSARRHPYRSCRYRLNRLFR